jgi:hypothetical protein
VARPRLGSRAHTVAVTVKLSAREAEMLDALRGQHARSAYLRSLLVTAGMQRVRKADGNQ